MARRLYPALLTWLVLAAPALATPQEDATCVVGRLVAADRPAIADDSMAGRSAEILGRLNPQLDVCSEGHDWTRDRRADAAAYAIGLVVSGEMRQRLGAQRIDVAALDRWFARQNEAFRTTAFLTMGNEEMETAFTTMVDHEVTAEAMERDGASIGAYVSALVIMERIARGLGL